MRVAVVGGVPAPLGGAGLELQVTRTVAALSRHGVEVHRVEGSGPFAFDILHGFGATPAMHHVLSHWSRNQNAPFVLSPVVQVGGLAPRILIDAVMRARRGPLTSLSMTGAVIRRADMLVALNETERDTVLRAGADATRVHIVPNGVDRVIAPDVEARAPGGRPVVTLVGRVSPRKRQLEALRALAPIADVVIIGGIDRATEYGRRISVLLDHGMGRSMGQVDDAIDVQTMIRGADVLVQFSTSEIESLAALEALALGTPVVASDIPPHRDLAHRYPGSVRLVGSESELVAEVLSVGGRSTAAVPTWDQVAERLVSLYEQALESRRA